MDSSTDLQPEGSLANTLLLALSQCQEQVQELAQRSKVIEDLRQENEQLRQELDQLRKRSNEDVEARFKTQFQNAFILVAEKEAEMERLKEKLYNIKAKAKRKGLVEPISSSPKTVLDNTEAGSPRDPSSILSSSSVAKKNIIHSVTPPSNDHPGKLIPPRKRQRSPTPPSREPLQELSPNTDPAVSRSSRTGQTKSRRQDRRDRGAAAIPEVAEDGDDDLKPERKTEGDKAKTLPGSVYHRLGDLLDGRGPASPMLLNARSNSPPGGTNNDTPAPPRSTRSGVSTPSTDTRNKRPRPSLTGSKNATRSPEDEEPFRARPLQRLGLTHFKLNPAANAGLEYAYNEVVRGSDRRALSGCTRSCCSGAFKALASTLPKLPAAEGQQMSDDDLLLGYLGHGSEERIRTMTPLAKENLVHEARTRIVADAYGKMHRDAHERGRSPPGFWRTDMPGSQEHREDRELAKAAEREEVRRRYNEAMKDGGKWIFADE